MTMGHLDFEVYLDAASEDVERIAVVASSGGPGRVPACPEWTVNELLEHLHVVYRRFLAQVRAGKPTSFTRSGATAPGAGGGADAGAEQRVEALEVSWHELRRALSDAGPGAPCWNFTGSDLDAAWVARRMAHETSVHRFDAESIARCPGPVERELAVDGIAELLEVGLPWALARARDAEDARPGALTGTICLVARDADAAFVIEVHGGALRWRRGRGPADVVAVGTASDLFLFCWNRRDVGSFEITGDVGALSSWADLPGV